MTTATASADQQPRPRKLQPLGRFVGHRVSALQRGFLAKEQYSVAALARLRRGVGKEVGELVELGQYTLLGLPEQEFEPDEGATYEERAAYTAITLYAVHQQSRSAGMHQPGIGLGNAVATLARKGNSDAVQRRFEALGTAESFGETVHHARGLITQLRGAGIGIDYGRFADELYFLQVPGGAARVRLQWGRDFYRRDRSDSAPTDPTDPDLEKEA
ncbi:type I-E CRISPR-associated protein Cse2/CasB [Natronosporangium hydrolyticum]|uniref:Type I-E CRISPR-associated protein Cse2/CasB n=1 Tax=Natronosporangium hydrolyticum TaxID=2811111 RepID=A0A895YJX4_9ACTN|nr:type I-E CRISPR-associated protein Cse2/CasB [Natronosporangium hydrolyticum]QSB14410.1 type I-E CRISPR-associated protein Cse2/CasB [Natronosporangium hydrolyticum]